MEDVWKLEQPMGHSQCLQQVSTAGLNQLAAAQEVCVVERTIRQESVGGPGNLINFGGLGLDGNGLVLKHQSRDQTNHTNNQLLALVQQQHQLNPCWSAPLLSPPEFTTTTPRSSSLINATGFLDNRPTECLETALFRKSNLSATPLAAPALPARPSYERKPSVVFPTASLFGRVSTPGIEGFPVAGQLLLTGKSRLEVVCCCHQTHMSVAAFVQHASGSRSVSPGANVVLETGENLVQWRKRMFSSAGVKVDDEVGWDWSDEAGPEETKDRRQNEANTNCLLPSSQSQSSPHLRLPHAIDVMQPQRSFNKPRQYPNLPTSEYFDFIDRAGRTYSQQLVRAQILRSDQRGSSEHRPEVSSIELRLGQPSQQAHHVGKSFVRSPFQEQANDNQSTSVYERAYQKSAASEPNFHHHELSGYHGLTQASMHQYGQQQRLEKININQFGIERTVLCERTKLWTEAPGQAFLSDANKALQENFLPAGAGSLLRTQNPENPLEQMMKQRLSSAQHSSIGLSNQYLSQEYSWTQRSSISSHGPLESQRLPSETNLLSSTEQELTACSGADVLHSLPRMTNEAYVPQDYRQQKSKVLLEDVRIVEEKSKPACFAHVTEEEEHLEEKEDSALRKENLAETFGRGNRPVVNDKLQCIETSEKAEERQQASVISTVPTSSGLVVSVGENEFPVTGQPERLPSLAGPVAESFRPLEASPLAADGSHRAENVRQDTDPDRSTSTDGDDATSESGVLSDASTKSSENALSGFPDENQVNEETSTLESESRKVDMVDEGSGVLRCCSEEQVSAEKAGKDSPSCSKRGGSSIEGSVMVETLERTSEVAHRNGVQTRKKRPLKLKSVNDTTSGDLQDGKHTEPKRTPQRRRSASNMKKVSPQEELQNHKRFDSDDRNHVTRPRRPARTGNGKMMSLKSILELSSKQKLGPQERCSAPLVSDIGRSCMTSSRKEVRKRKLSELSTEATCPTFVGPLATVIPRGERSPRGTRNVRMKTAGVELANQADFEQRQKRNAALLPKRKKDTESPGGSTAKKKKKSNQDLPMSTTYSCIDDLVPGVEKVKSKSLQNDSFDPPLRYRKAKGGKHGGCEVKDVCSVCGSASSESLNQLIHCSCCPVKVHQACYGVPKVPKASWTCRSCKSSAENIVCVLCGYGGGAMTRAQKAETAIKNLLAAWNAGKTNVNRGLRRSSRNPVVDEEEQRVKNTVTASMDDSSITQWIHMVCALWMPGTRCLNLETMGAFDVSGVSAGRRRLTCSICKRQGGSCIQCHEAKCAVPFHVWCAHEQGLLEIETVKDHVKFHGRCTAHAAQTVGVDVVNAMKRVSSSSVSKCARTEGIQWRNA